MRDGGSCAQDPRYPAAPCHSERVLTLDFKVWKHSPPSKRTRKLQLGTQPREHSYILASLTEPGLSPAGVRRDLYRGVPEPVCFERSFLCFCGLRCAGAPSPASSSSFSQHLAQGSWLPAAPSLCRARGTRPRANEAFRESLTMSYFISFALGSAFLPSLGRVPVRQRH